MRTGQTVSMEITAEPLDGFTVLHLRGEFDSAHCPRLQEEVALLLSRGVDRVALDLRKVSFINSTALGAILEVFRCVCARNGKLVIARPSRFCRLILQKLGLDRVIPVFDSSEDAGRALVEKPHPMDPPTRGSSSAPGPPVHR